MSNTDDIKTQFNIKQKPISKLILSMGENKFISKFFYSRMLLLHDWSGDCSTSVIRMYAPQSNCKTFCSNVEIQLYKPDSSVLKGPLQQTG